jgi:hypothetical protein
MKTSIRYIFLIAVMGLSFYAFISCNKENPATPTKSDMGILKTDEFGNILGGDYSDWCIHSPVDTFTYIKSFIVTLPQSNISLLKWTTSKEYHCYGFDVERRTTSDTNYFRIGFVNGNGTTNDSVSYVYIDTLQPNHPNYLYRLKQFDIYGNYKYRYPGVQNVYPISNSSFGPAYPNPTTNNLNIKFSIPRTDTISIYFADFMADTVFILNKEHLGAGSYEIQTYNSSNYHNVQKRLYIKSSSIQNSDSCRLYGDIQFN